MSAASTNLHSFPRHRTPIARTVTAMAPIEQYWTIRQVAQRLHAGESTVKKWLQSERLKKTKAGDKTLISETAIQNFLKACTDAG